MKAGAAAIVTNGRLVQLEEPGQVAQEDFGLLTLYANAAQIAQQVPPLPILQAMAWRVVSPSFVGSSSSSSSSESLSSESPLTCTSIDRQGYLSASGRGFVVR